MLSDKLVKLIEESSDEITRGWIAEIKSSSATTGYHDLSDQELRDKITDVFKRLSYWLDPKSPRKDVAMHYIHIGSTRYKQHFKLTDVIYAVILTKRHLLSYVSRQGLFNTAIELNSLVELYTRVGSFFDKVIYFISIGYDNALKVDMPEEAAITEIEKTVGGFTDWVLPH